MNILDIVYPKLCVNCGREGGYICHSCQKKLVKPVQICPMCCEPSVDGWTHGRCVTKYGMNRLVVGLHYRGMIQSCLKKAKYKSAWDIVGFIYKMCDFGSLGEGLICSVPMWKEKERVRGFNQADILAELVVASLPGVSRKAELLVRTRKTKPMFGLSKKERSGNIEGAFAISAEQYSNSLSGISRVVIVDDVWTTGSTMRECARVLKRAGVGEIWGLTLAR